MNVLWEGVHMFTEFKKGADVTSRQSLALSCLPPPSGVLESKLLVVLSDALALAVSVP